MATPSRMNSVKPDEPRVNPYMDEEDDVPMRHETESESDESDGGVRYTHPVNPAGPTLKDAPFRTQTVVDRREVISDRPVTAPAIEVTQATIADGTGAATSTAHATVHEPTRPTSSNGAATIPAAVAAEGGSSPLSEPPSSPAPAAMEVTDSLAIRAAHPERAGSEDSTVQSAQKRRGNVNRTEMSSDDEAGKHDDSDVSEYNPGNEDTGKGKKRYYEVMTEGAEDASPSPAAHHTTKVVGGSSWTTAPSVNDPIAHLPIGATRKKISHADDKLLKGKDVEHRHWKELAKMYTRITFIKNISEDNIKKRWARIHACIDGFTAEEDSMISEIKVLIEDAFERVKWQSIAAAWRHRCNGRKVGHNVLKERWMALTKIDDDEDKPVSIHEGEDVDMEDGPTGEAATRVEAEGGQIVDHDSAMQQYREAMGLDNPEQNATADHASEAAIEQSVVEQQEQQDIVMEEPAKKKQKTTPITPRAKTVAPGSSPLSSPSRFARGSSTMPSSSKKATPNLSASARKRAASAYPTGPSVQLNAELESQLDAWAAEKGIGQ